MRTHVALSLAAVLLAASPVLAHHISGTVYCDQDLDNMIEAGDTPGKLVRVSQSAEERQPHHPPVSVRKVI